MVVEFNRVRIRASAVDEPEERDVVSATVVIAGREFEVAVAVTDRKDMRYHMIVGIDILSGLRVHHRSVKGRCTGERRIATFVPSVNL